MTRRKKQVNALRGTAVAQGTRASEEGFAEITSGIALGKVRKEGNDDELAKPLDPASGCKSRLTKVERTGQ